MSTNQQHSRNPADQGTAAAFAYRHREGYPKLAYLMGMVPQSLHVRRFSVVATRNLLFLQYQLHVLEDRLLQIEANGGLDSVHVRGFFHQHESHATSNREQLDIYDQVRDKIREYEEALIRFKTLGALKADRFYLGYIQSWLGDRKLCKGMVSGLDANFWGSLEGPKNYMPDMVQVLPKDNEGIFAKTFKRWFMPQVHNRLLRRFRKVDQDGLATYNEDILKVVVSTIAVSVTSVVIYLAIGFLYNVQKGTRKLVTVFVTSAVVTICLAIFKNRSLIVAATTLVAVLVTLLANNDESDQTSG